MVRCAAARWSAWRSISPVVAEHLAGGGVALERWRRGQDGELPERPERPEGAALVSAAVYARALGHGGAFTRQTLERLPAHFWTRL
jgi:hypothetical protein